MEEQDLTQLYSLESSGNGLQTLHARSAALQIGSRIGNFEIEQVLGVGGFGIVYLAVQQATGRHVAIKEFFPSAMLERVGSYAVKLKSGDDESLFATGMRSFVNEATILSSLNHPGLVQVLHFWEENGTAYMAMPYYEGVPLSRHIAQQQSPSGAELIQLLFNGLLPTLEYLHDKQIFHRDISPDNIVILKTGQPLLLDFGAARRIMDKSESVTVILKSGYAPIEQYDETGEQGAWTDIYAFSALLYKVVTGHAPQASATRVYNDTMMLLANDPFFTAVYPVDVLRAIDAGLAVRPEHRPQSVAAWRKVLNGTAEQQPYIANSGSHSRNDSEPAIVVSRTPVASSKWRMIWIFLLPLVVFGAVLYIVQPDNYQRLVGGQLQKRYQVLEKQLADLQQEKNEADQQVAALQVQLAQANNSQSAVQLKQALLAAQEHQNTATTFYDAVKAKYSTELVSVKNTIQQAEIARSQGDQDDTSGSMYTLAQQQLQSLEFWHQDYKNSLKKDRLALIQKINGVWAPKSCQNNAATWVVDGQLLHILDDEKKSSEKIIAAYDDKIYTSPVTVTGAEQVDQLVEYQFSKGKLLVHKGNTKQSFVACN